MPNLIRGKKKKKVHFYSVIFLAVATCEQYMEVKILGKFLTE